MQVDDRLAEIEQVCLSLIANPHLSFLSPPSYRARPGHFLAHPSRHLTLSSIIPLQAVVDVISLMADVSAELAKVTEGSRQQAVDRCLRAMARVEHAQALLALEESADTVAVDSQDTIYLSDQSHRAVQLELDAIR